RRRADVAECDTGLRRQAVKEYVVYREGGSAAAQDPQQRRPDKRAVARVEADSPEEACRLAARDLTLDSGQYLSAEPAEEADAREAAMDRTARALGRPTGLLDSDAL